MIIMGECFKGARISEVSGEMQTIQRGGYHRETIMHQWGLRINIIVSGK